MNINMKVTPRGRKAAIDAAAKRKKALIDVRERRRVLVEELGGARIREASFRTTKRAIETALKTKRAALQHTNTIIEQLEQTLDRIDREIRAEKARTDKTTLTRAAMRSKNKRDLSDAKKRKKRFTKEISEYELRLKMNQENLTACQREITGILDAGAKVNAKLDQLTRR